MTQAQNSSRTVVAALREHRRWGVAALLFFVSTIAYLDRQTLSVLERTLEQVLGFSAEQYSYAVAGFMAATAAGYLFAGQIIDKFGVRKTFAIAIFAWSVAAACHALATGWVSLTIYRVALGLGECFYTPAAARVLSEWIPQRERGICWAVFSAGNFVGAIIAPPLVALLAFHLHWQYAFIVTAAFGFVLLAVWLFVYDSPERTPALSTPERALILTQRGPAATAATATSTIAMLGQPRILTFFFIRFLTDQFTLFFMFWLPRYLQTEHGFDLKKIGLMAWIPYLGADLGALGGGGMCDWLVRRGMDVRAARQRLMLAVACLTPVTLAAVRVDSAALAIALITFVMFLQAAWNTNLTTLIIEYTPSAQVSQAVALTLMGGAIANCILTPMAGHIIDRHGYVAVFDTLAFVHLAGFLVMTLGLRISQAKTDASPL